MKKKVYALLLLLLAVLLVTAAAPKVKAYQNYKKALSEEMANKVSTLAASIFDNEKMLTDILTAKSVTKPQADALQYNFRQIMLNAQDIDHLATTWNRVPEGTLHNETAVVANHASYFFQTDLNSPSADQLETIRQYQALGLDWANAIRTAVPELDNAQTRDPYWNAYQKNIEKDYWVNTILNLHKATKNSPLGQVY